MSTSRPARRAIELLFQQRADGRISSASRLAAYALKSAASVLESDAQALTSWIQVALVGDFVSPVYGEFSITKRDLSTMLDNFKNGVHPVPPTRLCMDYDHLSAAQPATPGAAKAAGWFVDLELRANGRELWAQIEWTEAGAAAIEAKEYLYVSPEFHPAFTTPAGDEVGCTLLASAITNRPFLQGMNPLALSATFGGVAVPKPVAGRPAKLADFSFDDTRARVCEALEARLGQSYSGYGDSYWYLVDVYQAFALYRRAGHLFQIDYVLDTDSGAVTFSSDPVEVVLQPAPLSLSAASGGSMSAKTFTLRDTKGNEVAISEEAFEQLSIVKELRAKVPTGEVVALADHQKVVADVVTLTTQVQTLTAASAKRDATDEVAALMDAGKILPAQKEHYVELALKDHDMFVKLTATLPVVSPVKPSAGAGSGQAGIVAGASATDEVKQLAAAAREKDPKLSEQAAVTQVLSTNRELYARYTKEHEVKV